MTKNKLKAKRQLIGNRVVGDVVQDVLKMYYLMIGQDNPVEPQILKNVIQLVLKSYDTEINGAPAEGPVVQKDLETEIAEIQQEDIENLRKRYNNLDK